MDLQRQMTNDQSFLHMGTSLPQPQTALCRQRAKQRQHRGSGSEGLALTTTHRCPIHTSLYPSTELQSHLN